MAPLPSYSRFIPILLAAVALAACIKATGHLPEGPPPEYEETPPPKVSHAPGISALTLPAAPSPAPATSAAPTATPAPVSSH